MPHTPGPAAKEIFADALDRPEAEREAFARAACRGDERLMAEVMQLLRSHGRVGQFMAAATVPPTGHGGPSGFPAESPGQTIGRYTLLEQIGEGGFGVVFRAEQRDPVQRQVALKIIRLGMDTRGVVARFEAERQALAIMNHPNIATVLDAGATATGRPYFVMELVRGRPITAYCDEHRLETSQRLELFAQVCQAVQHAHAKGIIHRDIKPGNVLVETVDGRPNPKIIDFGIAKATGGRLTERTFFTEARQFIGTPEYMSPEQAQGGGASEDIDTRSDVYSLGVLLYEMLTGVTPFDPKRLRSAAWEEMQRIIREQDPPKPSTRLSALKDTLASVAASRQVEPARLASVIRGDLDWIVMRCLEKDRSRRYATANALAEDVQRHLAGEPVTAAPPGRGYRARKFVRRHRVAVGTGALIGASLVVGLGTAIWQAGVARRDRDAAKASAIEATRANEKADQRRKELEEVVAFQASQLKGINAQLMGVRIRADLLADAKESQERAGRPSDQIEARLNQLSSLLSDANPTNVALKALDQNIFVRALSTAQDRFKEQPLVKSGLLLTLAGTLIDLGLLDRAAAPATEALEIRRRLLGDDDPQTFEAASVMLHLQRAQGKISEAETRARDTYDRCRKILGDDHPATLAAMGDLAQTLQMQQKFDEAETLAKAALDGRRRVSGEDDPATLTAIGNMGDLLQARGRVADSEPYFREALEKHRKVLGEEHPDTISCLMNLGSLMYLEGKPADAEPLLKESVEKSRRILGDDHPSTLAAVGNLGVVLESQGKLAEAEPLYREALDKKRRLFGPDHPLSLSALTNMGALLQREEKLEEAERCEREALDRCRAALKPDHTTTLTCLCTLGAIMQDMKRPADAEPLFREALGGLERTFGPSHWMVGHARAALGDTISQQGRWAEAEPLLLEGQKVLSTSPGAPNPRRRQCMRDIVALYEGWDKSEPGKGYDTKAAEWKTKLGPSKPAAQPPKG